ncbi:MAG TPA: CoA transferase [Hyphomicrobiaceae bacterium]|nr:CoA transferase [Hyphomicrobiaceae bacterium]
MTDAVKFDATRKGPVDGIRVVDMSRLVAGNMLSLQLADFGADVIKVEPPEGDALRHWKDNGKSLHWKVYARNKRSIVLNTRSADGRDALRKILAKSDVFIENFRPGTLEKMGLGPDELLVLNPDLIIVRVSGFGQTGPYAKQPGFGTLVEAMSGFAARTGFPDREPVLPPLALADMIAGLQGAMATMMALRARDRGEARGQVIDLSLLEPIFGVLGPDALVYRETGEVKERCGSASNTSAPRNVYKCADGKYVAMSGSMQAMAMRIFDVIGRPDMKTDPRFALNADRIRHRDLVDDAVGGWFAIKPRDEALAIMTANSVTVGPVYNIDEAVVDPHFIERQVIIEVEDDELGTVPMHNITPRLSGTPGVWRRQAPALGEHTDDVLRWAGYDDAAIADLRRKEAVV